ncbi:hypothetical protein CDO44_12520 [Pigmentiphaga sp. NML080357]|uniref:IclR family transcriptional regulator n=1 Tax=Pigmentiphaga sp. NML080357 TaxID=2008675 RepID=UPI000B412BDA|nr:helix-turn-helix domain-containing protein [Pigmentiphaga sp. NML080357]OVZ59425.1 hypothetical protein CDO44_12520 [Pigmentiphaga sp. NML080357]
MRRRKIDAGATAPLAEALAPTQVDSLQRGLEVLRLFDGRQNALSISDMATRLGLTRSTTAKLVGTLESFNFLRLDATGEAYEAHAACLALGSAARQGLDVVHVATPHMRALCERFGVHISLTCRDRLHMLVLEHLVPDEQPTLGLQTGARLPMAASASGRAYLWAQKPVFQAELIQLLKQSGQESVYRFMPGVYAAFQELEQNGWCFLASPVTRQSNSIATPIPSPTTVDHVLAAMSVGGVDEERRLREDIGPELLAAAAEIGRELESMA